MNKNRRIRINHIKELTERLVNDLNIILEEEQDYFDNMPENLQGSSRGMESEDAIDSLSDIIDKLSEVSDLLDEVV